MYTHILCLQVHTGLHHDRPAGLLSVHNNRHGYLRRRHCGHDDQLLHMVMTGPFASSLWCLPLNYNSTLMYSSFHSCHMHWVVCVVNVCLCVCAGENGALQSKVSRWQHGVTLVPFSR